MFQGPRILDIVPPEAAARCSRSAERGPLDIVPRSGAAATLCHIDLDVVGLGKSSR